MSTSQADGQPERAPSPLPGVAMLLAGAVVILGALLPWGTARLSRFGSIDYLGRSVSQGRVAIICGVALLVVGVIALLAEDRGVRRAMGVIAIAAGAIAIGLGIDVLVARTAQLDQLIRSTFVARTGHRPTQADMIRAHLLLSRLNVGLSPGAGLFVSIAGGIIGAVAGIFGLVQRRQAGTPLPEETVPEETPIRTYRATSLPGEDL